MVAHISLEGTATRSSSWRVSRYRSVLEDTLACPSNDIFLSTRHSCADHLGRVTIYGYHRPWTVGKCRLQIPIYSQTNNQIAKYQYLARRTHAYGGTLHSGGYRNDPRTQIVLRFELYLHKDRLVLALLFSCPPLVLCWRPRLWYNVCHINTWPLVVLAIGDTNLIASQHSDRWTYIFICMTHRTHW